METDVLAYVRERLAAGETLPSQATIAKRFRLPKQTVSRWMAKWEAAGLISRKRDGRRNVIRSSRPRRLPRWTAMVAGFFHGDLLRQTDVLPLQHSARAIPAADAYSLG